ncbi:Acetylornithine deacetylase/Succinyl-diaminopimelate desuccinylase [Monaibacterium marinum]|uniref:Acetylornithine deacetylase/Succinyl-diaminopimelate desuccinylase n=1 Tax=Pontivivens marinum TaxID=1690039 RepID=A0A2C9CSZ3_9RHOB|nr:M20/M25/M40 family metallo-hydrolase [Monaibacterium marinum]SOH94320.1 Acetylornithine deacetylase/Succinyl-diaminopimelate desuccinylase [Monaibacterium marinum]
MTSKTLDPVLEHIGARSDEYVTRLMDYVKNPSISAHNIGIREVSELLVAQLSALGMKAEAIPTKGHPFVLAEYRVDPDKPTVLLYGHYDVQPPDPLELWDSPPFTPTIRDGRIYARGVGDNKGQHFAQIMAIEAHLAVHGTLPCNVIFLLEGEEEIGSPQIADFVRDHRDRLEADFVVTADGPLHESGRATLTYGVRGMCSFEMRVKTAARDAHSGNYGGVMPNAIWTLVHLLGTMKTPDGQITIDGLHAPIIPATEVEIAASQALPLDLPAYMQKMGLSKLDAPTDRPFWDRLMFHPTMTINGLHGGYGGQGSKSVLPCSAVAKCDIRLVEAMTPQQVMDCVRAHVAKHAPEVEVIFQGGMLPSKTAIDSPWGQVIQQAITEARGEAPLVYPCAGGSLPDYVFTKILGVPAFVMPYANADEANHAPNENMEISLFLKGIQTGAALLDRLGRI